MFFAQIARKEGLHYIAKIFEETAENEMYHALEEYRLLYGESSTAVNLKEAIKAEGYDPNDYQWYLDLRKYGSVPHGGFGLGVERTVAWFTGEKHFRQCIAFTRMMDKVYI